MKRLLLSATLGLALLADEPRAQPSDAAITAYYKADSAFLAARTGHEALMENIKKAVADSVNAQIAAAGAVNAALSVLQTQCAGKLDLQALNKGDVKCLEQKDGKSQ